MTLKDAQFMFALAVLGCGVPRQRLVALCPAFYIHLEGQQRASRPSDDHRQMKARRARAEEES